jgi:hypothetical protein
MVSQLVKNDVKIKIFKKSIVLRIIE